VIFDETKQLLLIPQLRTEMKPNTFGILMLQAVIEPLVIAEIKPLLLKLPLQIAVGLGDEEKVRMKFLHSGNDFVPIVSRVVVRTKVRERTREIL
jgi:hypothetical protein